LGDHMEEVEDDLDMRNLWKSQGLLPYPR
jgi:hypothetical protein